MTHADGKMGMMRWWGNEIEKVERGVAVYAREMPFYISL